MKSLFVVFLVLVVFYVSLSAQTTAFTYQGSLQNGGSPASGNFDFEFKLFDLVSSGAQQGSTIQRLNVTVTNGSFIVSLDFGAGTFPGADRYLDIAVRTAGGGAFTPLAPRTKVNSAPYSVKSLNSTTADSAINTTQLGGISADQYVVTTDPRMTDSRTPTAGSANYIQNGSSPQSSSNFNIDGTGSATFLNAAQYNLNNARFLSAPANNLFVGLQAGQSNTTGDSNSFFGRAAGLNNTSGGNNSFFGYLAGNTTNTGNGNAFFGYQAGRSNTTGGVNSYFGFNAGEFSTTANYNSFFGFNAGNKTTADDNSFFGAAAGQSNTSGTFNSFFGRNAGFTNTTSGSHVFVGVNAGYSNTTGGSNTFVGKDAGFANNSGGENAFFGAATGQSNTTGSNNSFVGTTAGLSNTSGGDNSFMGHGAGYSNAGGISNSFFGSSAGSSNVAGNSNSLFGRNAGVLSTGSENSFFGTFAGGFNTTGNRNTAVGYNANVASGNLQYATAIGADSTVSTSNTIALGRSNGSDQVVIPGNLVANLPAGDGDYIQNTTSPQSANFNLSGNGTLSGTLTVGNVNATTLTAVGVTSNSLSSTSGLFLNSSAGGRIALRTSGTTERMTILDNGNVGIGNTNPTSNFQVGNIFNVDVNGVRLLLNQTSQAGHVCISNLTQYLAICQSAAEYVPSIDKGVGFPETADLVSIAPDVKNPYGDTHGPFTVEKSVKACDANLLGFIVNPESGANGPKLNDHYLPLSIYGYFPAKVTMENGPIKRGDPITSSSKAGYGMKATNACKIIGYALEDADQEGKIQVFSHLTEYSAPVVEQLRSQVETQQTVIDKLEKRLEQLEKKETR